MTVSFALAADNTVLQHLDLLHCALAEQAAWQHIFPANRKLTALTALSIAGTSPPMAASSIDALAQACPEDGTVLSVRLRVGEFVPASILSTPFISLGVIDPLHVRVDIDEAEIPRFSAGAKAYASLRGKPGTKVPLQYVRTEPLVVPKRTLTGTVSERVDTRVLQVIYSAKPDELKASVGQQVDVYIEGKID